MKKILKWIGVSLMILAFPIMVIGLSWLAFTLIDQIPVVYTPNEIETGEGVTDEPVDPADAPTIPSLLPKKEVIVTNQTPITEKLPPIWKKYPVLVLEDANTLVFRNVVTDKSVSKLLAEAIKKSKKLPKHVPFYLFLDTPGGSVPAGELAIDTFHGLGRDTKTISMVAASMGFHWVQNLGDRLILPAGRLMSHRMRVEGLGGQIPGEAVTRMQMLIEDSENLSIRAANRMQLTLPDYENLIEDEYWTRGKQAVADRAADKVVLVKCGNSLQGTYTDEIEFIFGITIPIKWSKCPLIAYPVAIGKPKREGIEDFIDEMLEAEKFVEMLIYEKQKFIDTYITTGKLLNVK